MGDGPHFGQDISVPHFKSLESLLEAYTFFNRKRSEFCLLCVPSTLHVSLATNVIGKAGPKDMLRRRKSLVGTSDVVEEGAAAMLESGVIDTLILCDNVAGPYSLESATGENMGIAQNRRDSSLGFGCGASPSAGDLGQLQDLWQPRHAQRAGWSSVALRPRRSRRVRQGGRLERAHGA